MPDRVTGRDSNLFFVVAAVLVVVVATVAADAD